MKEEWRPVIGHPGYEVSNKGRVRSINRVVQTKRGPFRYRGRILSPSAGGSRSRYMQIKLGAILPRKVHHLVLEAFVGPRPPGCVGRHGPGGWTDNSVGNLCWGSQSENLRDAVEAGTYMSEKRAAHLRKINGGAA